MQKIKKYWVEIFAIVLILLQLFVFLIFKEESYIAVHDNLDLFVSQLQILKNTDTFFAHGVSLPMLGGISRDTFGSQFNLYNILYFIFPSFVAYVIGYFLKIGIGFFSFQLLFKEVLAERYGKYRSLICLSGLGYGLIPVFPAYGIAFTSIPILLYLLIRIYKKPSWFLYLALFCYPLLSYFSYFGIFILAYMVIASIVLWIKDRKFPGSIVLSVFVLSLGYILIEYRLFHEMLFKDVETIRSTMVIADFNFAEILTRIVTSFISPVFHAQDSHMYLILPVAILGLFILNFFYIKRKEYKKMMTDSCNLIFLFIIFNCVICGMYNWKALRDFVEMILPPLTGFQFDRTIYFNPFLWFVLFFLLLKKLYDTNNHKWISAANVLVAFSVIVVMFVPQTYNDFWANCKGHAYELLKGKAPNALSYKEFYSEDLFEKIKEDIDYDGEWSVAYGFHPAVLQYNNIATLDGYLGFYSTDYHEKFRKVISPALDGNDWARSYYDDWGARAYIFSGSGEDLPTPFRNLDLKDHRIMIDSDAFKELDGVYLFSRIEASNAEEIGLDLRGVYSEEISPYTIYVYEVN